MSWRFYLHSALFLPKKIDKAKGVRLPFSAPMFLRLEVFEEAMWVFWCFVDVAPGSTPTGVSSVPLPFVLSASCLRDSLPRPLVFLPCAAVAWCSMSSYLLVLSILRGTGSLSELVRPSVFFPSTVAAWCSRSLYLLGLSVLRGTGSPYGFTPLLRLMLCSLLLFCCVAAR